MSEYLALEKKYSFLVTMRSYFPKMVPVLMLSFFGCFCLVRARIWT